jgi:protein-tyrosine phosphatase
VRDSGARTGTDVTETVVVGGGPDVAWGVVGDVASVARWVPGVSECRLEGDLRHLTYADGSGAVERIVAHDDAGRSYVYDYVSGRRAFDRYRSQMSVQGHACGAEVVWASTFSAGSAEQDAELTGVIGNRYRTALRALKEEIEG